MDPENPQHDPFEPGPRVAEEYRGRLTPVRGATWKRLPAALPFALAGMLAVGGIAFGATVVVPKINAHPTPVLVGDETEPPVLVGDETEAPAATTEPTKPIATQKAAGDPTAGPTTEPTTGPTDPAAPGSLSLTASIVDGKVKLAWTAFTGDGFAYYKIVRSVDGTVNWPADGDDTLIAAIGQQSATSFVDAAPRGKTFRYAVFAVRSSDEGYAVLAASNVRTVAVPAAADPPRPTEEPTDTPSGPVNLGAITVAIDADGCYTLRWKAFDAVDFSYWKLVHGPWGSSPYYPAFPYWAVLDPGATSWHSCDIEPGDYAVRAQAIYYPDGDPAAAAQTSILHLVVAGSTPTVPPTVNLGSLTVTSKGNGCYTFAWPAFDAVDFSYWKLVHGPWGSSPTYPAFDYWAALDPSATSWTGCVGPGDYAVRVQAIYYPHGSAVAAAQTTVYHLTVAAATPTPPPSPVTLAASFEVTPDGVRISWTAYAGDGFQYYKVVRSETNASPTFPENAGTTLLAAISTRSTTTLLDAEAAAGHTYYYRVLAVRSDGGWVTLGKSAVLKVVVP